MVSFRFIVFGLSTLWCCVSPARNRLEEGEEQPLRLPAVGSSELRVLNPSLLELTLITTKKPGARVDQWDFVSVSGQCHLPSPQEFAVTGGQTAFSVKAVGFKRRVLYAPFKHSDLRIGNYLYLQLATPIPEGQGVGVKNPDQKLWPPTQRFVANTDPLRWSPAIHVNQTGYSPSQNKRAMVGYYLGSLGEMGIDIAQSGGALDHPSPATNFFKILEATSSREVFQGTLAPRPDRGFPFPSYERVLEADFTALKTPGEYRLFVPGLGVSFSFCIDEGIAGSFARAYALGIYHQRCGAANDLPFTRFTHKECHTAPAEVPTMAHKFASVNESLKKESANYKDNPRHTAPQLKDVEASLYPFVNRGPVDVRGGHHDAGDYSKYTANSAGFIHRLLIAADVFPGVSELDNLGIPESGDSKSDILQEIKWEADFLARMQDSDGGFYFLVYPRDREYEIDVLPDHGDPQIVFPKTTSVTAAATAALAQCAGSPAFKKQFPEAAVAYLEHARKGWAFLERAIAKFGKDGAYQKITHYADDFMHDDELTWAACELFLATGEPAYHKKVQEWLDPSNPEIRKWGWWRLYDAYGCAIRSYAFAAKSGRLKREQLDRMLLERCEAEIAASGADQLHRAQASAYGTSFPEETKRVRAAGWYFSADAAFDLAVACQLDYPVRNDPRPAMMDAVWSNLNYEEGCNPINVTYLTGLGWKRQREIVHQYAQNDRRILPPTGIPLGNIQGGFTWMDSYKKDLGDLSFPSDGDQSSPYPFYDRWGDAFNLSQEFVILNQASALACTSWLMARTSLKAQPWKAVSGKISIAPAKGGPSTLTATLSVEDLDLNSARIVWEAEGQEPTFGKTFALDSRPSPQWVEAEAQWPDGRRVFAVTNLSGAKLLK